MFRKPHLHHVTKHTLHNIQMGVERFITFFKQLSNEDTQYLMPHIPHGAKTHVCNLAINFVATSKLGT